MSCSSASSVLFCSTVLLCQTTCCEVSLLCLPALPQRVALMFRCLLSPSVFISCAPCFLCLCHKRTSNFPRLSLPVTLTGFLGLGPLPGPFCLFAFADWLHVYRTCLDITDCFSGTWLVLSFAFGSIHCVCQNLNSLLEGSSPFQTFYGPFHRWICKMYPTNT